MTNLEAALFTTTTKCARDLQVGDAIVAADGDPNAFGRVQVVAHIEGDRRITGYDQSGVRFSYRASDVLTVQVLR